MPKNVSFLQYMTAHGNTPGPTQRPLLSGAICGLLAEIPALLALYFSGAIRSVALSFGLGELTVVLITVGWLTLAGIVYAAIFKGAANDRHGGWLFGMSYGFFLWLVAPITVWQVISSRPAAVGSAAMGLFAAHVIFGFVLGLIFPWIHKLIQRRLREVRDVHSTGRKIDKASSRERARSHLETQGSGS